MAIDLDKMSEKELQDLRLRIDQAMASLKDRRRAEARAAAERAVADMGFSLDELVGAQKKTARKSAPKYRNPEDPRQTWTGKGRQPGWIKDGLNSGKTLDDFAI